MPTPLRTSTDGDTTSPTCWICPSHSLWTASSGASLVMASARNGPEVDESDRLEASGFHLVARANAIGLGRQLVIQLLQPLIPVALVGLDLLSLVGAEQRQLVRFLVLLRTGRRDALLLSLEDGAHLRG